MKSISNLLQDRKWAREQTLKEIIDSNPEHFKAIMDSGELTEFKKDVANSTKYEVQGSFQGVPFTIEKPCTCTESEFSEIESLMFKHYSKMMTKDLLEKTPNFKENPDVAKALKQLKKVGYILPENQIIPFIRSILDLNRYIKDLDSTIQSNLWVYGEEGNGKSTLGDSILESYKAIQVLANEATFPNWDIHSTSISTFCKNRFCYVKDVSESTRFNEDLYKGILRHETQYVRPAYGKTELEFKPLAGVYVSSNVPEFRGDRTFTSIETIPVRINNYFFKRHPELKIKESFTPKGLTVDLTELVSLTDPSIYDKLDEFETLNISAGDDSELIKEIKKISNIEFVYETLKDADSSKGYIQLKDVFDKEDKSQIKLVSKVLTKLSQLGLDIENDGNSNLEYRKWNVSALFQFELEEITNTSSLRSSDMAIEKSLKMFDKLIAFFETEGPDGGKDDENDKELEVVETEQPVETIKEEKPVEVVSNENKLVENTPKESCKEIVEAFFSQYDIKPEDICLKPTYKEEKEEIKEETVVSEELVFTPEDAKHFGTPICANKMSKPQFESTGEFLVTAEYTEEAKKEIMAGKDIDRKGENMRPVFFVYESDDLPKDEQLKKAMEVKEKFPEAVFSITDSGSKSIHTLVYIKPEYRDLVEKDFKYAWSLVGERLFGSTEHLDRQCASIARLSRLPGGIRDNGANQTCYYINRKVKGLDLTWVCMSIPNRLAQKEQRLSKYMEIRKQLEEGGYDFDTVEHLKRAVAKSNNPSGQLAVDLVEGRQTPSGSNLIGAIGYASRVCGPYVESLVKEEAHRQHPTNIR